MIECDFEERALLDSNTVKKKECHHSTFNEQNLFIE